MGHKTVDQDQSLSQTTAEELDRLIDFYKQPEFIQMLSQQLAGQPSIDFNKVAKIKEAISNNQLDINYKDLAEKLISFESELEITKK